MSAREYPDRPWVGIGVIAFRGESVLLAQRGKPPRIGLWSLPGGAQHLGEGAEAAAEAMLGAMDRVEAVLDGRPVQLRLSGGKDSRTLLALLKGRDMEVHAVTFGEEPRPENRDPNDPKTWGKVGRNEPCPCGSGKKYKHCHGSLT